MAYDHSRLIEITTIANSAAAVYTHSSGTAYLRQLIVHNGNTTAEAVKLYQVPNNGGSAGTAGTTNIFYSKSLVPNETVTFDFGTPGMMFKDANDTLQASTTTASKVTIQGYGGAE
jgi:hypothetical protein